MSLKQFLNSLPADYSYSNRAREERSPREHALNDPKRRAWNNNPHDDFVAIDFETATGLRTSACALGMVKVIDGEIVQKYYTIINPIRDEYTDRQPNLRIHKIPLSVAEKVETFAEIFEFIRGFIGNFKLICHCKGADIAILKKTMEYYGLTGINTENVVDTYEIYNQNLALCCESLGIPLPEHHDALCDAEACARLYLAHLNLPYIPKRTEEQTELNPYGRSAIPKEIREKLSEENIENKDTVFYNAKVVITGTFTEYPDRNLLAAKIQKCGAKICQGISKCTNIVVVGEDAGPKKLETIAKLQADGLSITVLKEADVIKILTQ